MSKVRNILIAVFVLTFLVSSMAVADPLDGQILKFQQKPMIGTTIDGVVYNGHDEVSTAWGNIAADGTLPNTYTGIAMVDDFADQADTPVIHVRWWGSYLTNNVFQPVTKFLIAFESDQPKDAAHEWSEPDQVLSAQIVTMVTAGPLVAGSGTYTETQLTDTLAEDIYEYNAELHLDKQFAQNKDTVYWLKIVALVDVPANNTDLLTRWGWHNRDYTTTNALFSAAVIPGERDEQPIIDPDYPSKVWHFQDDAVESTTTIGIPADSSQDPVVSQGDYFPHNYVDDLDGPGPDSIHGGIGQFSKDLAFELYTVPEPATLLVLALGLVPFFLSRTRARRK